MSLPLSFFACPDSLLLIALLMCATLKVGVLVVQDAITKYCRLGGIENNLFHATLEAGKFSVKMLADQVFVRVLFKIYR